MIRATYMRGQWLGVEILSADNDIDNIEMFLEEGTPVMLIEDEEQAVELGVSLQ